MAFADIEKKIIQDAQKEAAVVVKQAQGEQTKRLNEVRKEQGIERERLAEELRTHTEQSVDQNKHLLLMESGQDYLKEKRKYLALLLQEVVEELVRTEPNRQAFFKKMLARIAPQIAGEKEISIETSSENKNIVRAALPDGYPSVEIKTHTGWAAGRCEIVLPRARIDCSVDRYVAEQGKLIENEIARMLFEK